MNMVKRILTFYLKALEFRFRTWKQGREIDKAYSSPFRIAIPRRVFVWTGVAMGTVAVAAVIVTVQPWTWIPAPAPRVAEEMGNQIDTQIVVSIGDSTGTAPAEEPLTAAEAQTEPELEIEIGSQWAPTPRMRFVILANKATKQLNLLRRSYSTWSVYRQYPLAIGEILGRKLRQGDKKTPEGIYFIVGRKEGNELPNIYGPLAFVLNYPNDDDRRSGRTGTGIWIHGTDPDSMPLQTRGCLELENPNMEELGDLLNTGIGVAVIIVNDSGIQDPAAFPDYGELLEQRKRVLAKHLEMQREFAEYITRWKSAWEEMDIDKYSSFYDQERFADGGMDWQEYRQKKLGTFSAYSRIKIGIDKLLLADYSESMAVVKFLQDYTSDKFQVSNGKKLLLNKSNGRWRIYREGTFSQEEHLL